MKNVLGVLGRIVLAVRVIAKWHSIFTDQSHVSMVWTVVNADDITIILLLFNVFVKSCMCVMKCVKQIQERKANKQ